jgi:hypothetical protein
MRDICEKATSSNSTQFDTYTHIKYQHIHLTKQWVRAAYTATLHVYHSQDIPS